MKYKRNVIIILVIILCIYTVNVFNSRKNFTIEGVKLSLLVDGKSKNSFPETGEYLVTVDCVDVTGIWNYAERKLELSNIVSNTAACNITFTSSSNGYEKLNEKIINLEGTIQGNGRVVNEPNSGVNYRYEGKDPNNYILFNNELWRIIGVFDSNTHDMPYNLTKIIRNESIGGFLWQYERINSWSYSDLKTILNDYYYYQRNGSDSISCRFYKDFENYKDIYTADCNFTINGINEFSRNMIQTVTWKFGGNDISNYTTNIMYDSERGTDLMHYYPRCTGNVGLMYPSDYGYSVLSTDCSRDIYLENYNNFSCAGQTWLLKYSKEWTMTPSSTTTVDVFYIYDGGSVYVSSSQLNHSASVRPVVYLKSDVYIISGDGSIINPYILGI